MANVKKVMMMTESADRELEPCPIYIWTNSSGGKHFGFVGENKAPVGIPEETALKLEEMITAWNTRAEAKQPIVVDKRLINAECHCGNCGTDIYQISGLCEDCNIKLGTLYYSRENERLKAQVDILRECRGPEPIAVVEGEQVEMARQWYRDTLYSPAEDTHYASAMRYLIGGLLEHIDEIYAGHSKGEDRGQADD